MSHQQELQPTALPRAGDILLGRYVVEGVLTRGGFATIYRGRQLGVDRTVAIKCLDPDSVHMDPAAPQRFAREAKLSSGLVHPNTITIFDYGRTKRGILFLVMEYVEGVSLNRVLRYGRIDAERASHLILQLLQSLREAHGKAIIHRDLKPANIMVCDRAGEQDVVKVLDFGIAKALGEPAGSSNLTAELTGADRVIGTPRYMAPEQLAGEAISPATDLYSVALIFFEMLSGRPAVDKGSSLENMAAQLAEEAIPAPADVPEPYRDVLRRGLQKDARYRFQSAEEFIEAIEAARSQTRAEPSGAHDRSRVSREVAEAKTLSVPREVVDELRPLAMEAAPAVPMEPSGAYAPVGYAGGGFGARPRLLLLFNVLLGVLLVAVGVTLGVVLVTQLTNRGQPQAQQVEVPAPPMEPSPATYAVPGAGVLAAPEPAGAAPAAAPESLRLEVEAARLRVGEALLTAANTAEPLVFVFEGEPATADLYLGPDHIGTAGEPLTLLRQRLPAEVEIASPDYQSAYTWVTAEQTGAIRYHLEPENERRTASAARQPEVRRAAPAPAPSEQAAAPTVRTATEPVPAILREAREAEGEQPDRSSESASRDSHHRDRSSSRERSREAAEPEAEAAESSRILLVDEAPPTEPSRSREERDDRDRERNTDEAGGAGEDDEGTPTALSPL